MRAVILLANLVNRDVTALLCRDVKKMAAGLSPYPQNRQAVCIFDSCAVTSKKKVVTRKIES